MLPAILPFYLRVCDLVAGSYSWALGFAPNSVGTAFAEFRISALMDFLDPALIWKSFFFYFFTVFPVDMINAKPRCFTQVQELNFHVLMTSHVLHLLFLCYYTCS